MILIDDNGLAEGIRCALCTNPIANDMGCDGFCVVNEYQVKKVIDVIDKAKINEECINRKELDKTLYEHFHEEDTGNITDVRLGAVRNFVRNFQSINSQEPKTKQYEKHIDHTDCIWYGSDSGCPTTCSQYRDGWNDAMDYIFKNGKGYQPYRHDG